MNLESIKTCLDNVFTMAVNHPCCDVDLLESKDMEGLCEIGGDVCDWTTIAIEAQEALEELENEQDNNRE